MRTSKLLFAAVALSVLPSTSRSADLFWGPSGAGGSGTWDNGITANWFNGGAVPWSGGNTAVFGGAAGEVALSGTIPGVAGMRFDTTGYFLGGGVLELTLPQIAVGSGRTALIGSSLDGINGLTVASGSLMLTNVNTLTGKYTVDPGAKLVVNGNGTFSTNGNPVDVNGTLSYLNGGSSVGGRYIAFLSGSGAITADDLINPGVANTRLHAGDFAGSIQDGSTPGRSNAVVMHFPAGLLRLSGNNTYSGQTLIRGGGTLRLDSPGALSPNTWLRFEETATDRYQMAELAFDNIAATNAAVAGGVSFANAHAGFAALGADRFVTITNPAVGLVWGVSHFNVKSLNFGSSNSTHKVTWTGPFSLGTPSSGSDRPVGVFDGPPAVDAEITAEISGGPNARLYKTGTGTLLLSGNNVYSGQTYLAQGTLALGNDQAVSTTPVRFHLNGATLKSADMSARTLNNEIVFALDGTIGTPDSGNFVINGVVTTGAGGKTMTINNAMTTFAGGMTGDSANPNIKAGPGTLVIDSLAISGKPLVVAEGTLALGSAGGLLTSNIVVGSNGIFDVTAVPGFTLASSGLPQSLGGGGLIKGSVTSGSSALITPGEEIGKLTFANDLTLDSTRLRLELTNDLAAGLNDSLQVNGNLNLSGLNSIEVVPVAGGNLANGTYNLIQYGGALSGSLGNLALSGFGGGTTRQVANLDASTAHQINLVVSGAPANLVWKGDDTVNPTAWDVVTTANWFRGGVRDTFYNYDHALFNDTAASFNVNLAGPISASTVTVETAGNYSFLGSGNLTGVGSLIKNGPGTLLLANFGINDYTGPTAINGGKLIVGNNDTSGSIGSGSVTNNGTLILRNVLPLSIPGAMSGWGALVAEGQGEVVLNGNNAEFAGSILVSPNARVALLNTAVPASTDDSLGMATNITVLDTGALFVGVGGTYPQPLKLRGIGLGGDNTGALRTAGNVNWTGPVQLEADTAIGADSGTLTIAAPLNDAVNLTKVGAGRLVLATNNNYLHTTIIGGALQVGTGGTAGTLGQSTAPISNDGTLEFNRSDDITFNNQITGTGGVTKNGSGVLTLNGASTFTGEMRIAAGALAVANDAATGQGSLRLHLSGVNIRSSDMTTRTIGNSVDFAASAIFGSADSGDLVFTGNINTGNAAKDITVNNATTTFQGVLAGGPSSSANRKLGPGTLILNGINTYLKPTTVSGGTLLVNGQIGDSPVNVTSGTLGGIGTITGPVTVQSGGTLSPGPGIGTLTINNALTNYGTVAIDINKTSGTSDLIQGPSSVTLEGTLAVTVTGNLAINDQFKIIQAAAISGTFTNIVPSQPGSGLSWDLSTLNSDGILRIASGPIMNPTINASVVGNQIKLAWPAGSWKLQAQTNAPGLGLGNVWFDVPGTSTTNEAYLTIEASNGSVFYRLVSQ